MAIVQGLQTWAWVPAAGRPSSHGHAPHSSAGASQTPLSRTSITALFALIVTLS